MDDSEDFQQLFFAECNENIEVLQARLDDLLLGSSDPEVVHAAFRAVHSIKGGAAAFGFGALVNFAHELETLLDRLRSGAVALSAEVAKTLLRATDIMTGLVEAAHDGTPGPVVRAGEIIRQIRVCARISGIRSRGAARTLPARRSGTACRDASRGGRRRGRAGNRQRPHRPGSGFPDRRFRATAAHPCGPRARALRGGGGGRGPGDLRLQGRGLSAGLAAGFRGDGVARQPGGLPQDLRLLRRDHHQLRVVRRPGAGVVFRYLLEERVRSARSGRRRTSASPGCSGPAAPPVPMPAVLPLASEPRWSARACRPARSGST